MLRTHTCGELRITHVGQPVSLTGWVQRQRDKGSILWIDLRDRYGITQLFFEEGSTPAELMKAAKEVGREYVIQANGIVAERLSKNDKLPTGDIEVKVTELVVLNVAKTPPFTIEDNTDGGDELRMKYRYLDLRRNPVRESLQLRHKVAQQTRAYLDSQNFIEVETPVLIKSTPEGARDFVVPSRIHTRDNFTPCHSRHKPLSSC
jgi:aspartyl-tRNA synthetase